MGRIPSIFLLAKYLQDILATHLQDILIGILKKHAFESIGEHSKAFASYREAFIISGKCSQQILKNIGKTFATLAIYW